MDLNRRTLLQMFGIGTVITPVLGGAPVVEAAAKLLAVPVLAPIAPFPDGHVPELFQDRMKWNPYEALWLHFWQIENNPPSAVNYGIGPLEHILGRTPTDAEKSAVAGVIQWFGSNCGHAFIVEVLEASGYKVPYAGVGKAEQLRQMQRSSIWPGVPMPPSVTVRHRGRQITLAPGQYPEVK